MIDLAACAAWRGGEYDEGHFGRWRSCSRTCASSFCDSSRALEIPGEGTGRTCVGDSRGDVILVALP
jgi:hypothetical protein